MADDGIELPGVDVDELADAEHPRHHVAVRVHRCLLGGDPALAHEPLDEAVVLGEALELALDEPVDARVAHVGHRQADAPRVAARVGIERRVGHRLVVGHHDREGAHGRAHAPQLGLAGAVPHRGVGPHHGVGERVHVGVGHRPAERVDRDLRGDLAAGVATHPVGDRHDALADEGAVLVDGAAAADVGDRSGGEADHASSRTTEPTWRRSPDDITIGPMTRARLR